MSGDAEAWRERGLRDAVLAGDTAAWGRWLAAVLAETNRRRLARMGVAALASEDGMVLFDAATVAGPALLAGALPSEETVSIRRVRRWPVRKT